MEYPDGLKLNERLVTAAEMAQIMGVDVADVFAWIESGELDVRRGEDGEARVPIRERREIDGPFESGLTFYRGPRDPLLLADARAKRRAGECDAQIVAVVDVDIDRLTAALAQRLAAVAPPGVRIDTTERGMVDVLDVRGGGAGIDIALVIATGESGSRSPADRVVDACQRLLEAAQEEIAGDRGAAAADPRNARAQRLAGQSSSALAQRLRRDE